MFDRQRLETFIKDPRTLRDFEALLREVTIHLPNDIKAQSAADVSQLNAGIDDAKASGEAAIGVANAALLLAVSIAALLDAASPEYAILKASIAKETEEKKAEDAELTAWALMSRANVGATGSFVSGASTIEVENGLIVRIT
jgi:hypothetical protein